MKDEVIMSTWLSWLSEWDRERERERQTDRDRERDREEREKEREMSPNPALHTNEIRLRHNSRPCDVSVDDECNLGEKQATRTLNLEVVGHLHDVQEHVRDVVNGKY